MISTPTALVHEAYIRLVDGAESARWDTRRHFFAAAAEAMRRILVEAARRRQTLKRGAGMEREKLDEAILLESEPNVDLCALDAALEALRATDPKAAELVDLRYFAGLTSNQAAELLQVSPRTADRISEYARTWLLKTLRIERPPEHGRLLLVWPGREPTPGHSSNSRSSAGAFHPEISHSNWEIAEMVFVSRGPNP